VDWRFGLWNENKRQDTFFERNAVLWFDYLDELTGFYLSEDGSLEFQMIVDPKYPILNQFMIDDLKTKYGNIRTVCSQKDEVKKACLLRNDFRDNGSAETTFVYRADEIALPNREPVGYTTIGMDEYGNIEEQIRLKNNAFNGGKTLRNHEIAAYYYVKQSPIYDPSMDLVLIGENGKPVSGCEGFIDYANGIMEIERICTHEDYRHRGLAKAVIAGCIKRGLSRGVRTVQITGWNDETCHLYGSFGEHTVIVKHRYVYDELS
jgi:GNAT superfamily N-acetyltransferase